MSCSAIVDCLANRRPGRRKREPVGVVRADRGGRVDSWRSPLYGQTHSQPDQTSLALSGLSFSLRPPYFIG